MPKKWEYRVINLSSHFRHGNIDVAGAGKELNKVAEEGWELVTVTDTTHSMFAYFKREKPQ